MEKRRLFKRYIIILSSLLLATLPLKAGDDIFRATSKTPHDPMMARVQHILKISGEGSTSIAQVNRWIREIRTIPYKYHSQWQKPTEVASRGSADCKGKSIYLYKKLRYAGADNVKLVIGKRTPGSRVQHAWLTWQQNGQTYVLDPTYFYQAYPSSKLPATHYRAYYAYDGRKKYRAS